MIRHVDDLGRLVIPKEWRTELKINNGDDVNMELQGDKIIITNPNSRDEFEEWLESFADNENTQHILNQYKYYKSCK